MECIRKLSLMIMKKRLSVWVRNLITLCELNKLYPKDDEMWNANVTAGNKLVTINTTYGMKSLSELKDNEKKAVYHYISKYTP